MFDVTSTLSRILLARYCIFRQAVAEEKSRVQYVKYSEAMGVISVSESVQKPKRRTGR